MKYAIQEFIIIVSSSSNLNCPKAFITYDNMTSRSNNMLYKYNQYLYELGFVHWIVDKAETLEGEERRQYAEKVAVAFWKAIGGDEGEIDGLGDDSD